MNDYAVIKNALVATFFVVIFMVSLQPEKVSSVVLNITNFATDAVYSKDIDAAETNRIADNMMSFSISSIGFVLPKDVYTVKTDKENSLVSKGDNELVTLTVGDFQGNLQDIVIGMTNEYKANNEYEKISLQPVLRGTNLYYEVTDNGNIVMAVKDIGDNKYLNILPKTESEQTDVESLLRDLDTL